MDLLPINRSSVYSLKTMLAYLEGQLDPEIQAVVEAALKSDVHYAEAMENLDRELQTRPDATHQMAADFQAGLAQMLDQAAQAIPSEKKKPANAKFQSWYVAAAAVVLLLCLPFGYWWSNRSPGLDQLENQHLGVYSFSTVRLGETRPIETALDTALDYYAMGQKRYLEQKAMYQDSLPKDMEIAIQRFESILAAPDSLSITEQLKAHMGLGMGLLLKKEPAMAQSHFQFVVDHQNNSFLIDALWYRAWSLLKQNKMAEAKTAFQELADRPNVHQASAQIILKSIK